MNENINISTNDFFLTVQNHLINKKPLSVIRYGDGESMMFNNNRPSAEFILKKVLGYIPSEEEIEALTKNLINSYKECDIIGIPTERHLSRPDQWATTLEYFKEKVGEDILHLKTKTSIDIFYDMLAAEHYDLLLKNIDSLNYISCRNLDKVFKNRFGIKNVNSFIISPEPTYTSGYLGDKHYPEQFIQIQKWIKSIDCKGVLCLVGAGIPGKPYNNWFRDQGGVSLDLGSVFDAWAGKKTRGKGRGLDVEDLTNKL